jgi:ABC-2 type transport system permease protein
MNTVEPTADLKDAQAAPALVRHPPVLRTLIRREFWEHRALWMAPMSGAALLLVGAIIGKVSFDTGFAIPEQRRALFAVGIAFATVLQFITLGIVTWMYAGDCLYTERKDRSILFWKSMPVSDTLTVLSKVLVVMVILPLGVYLLSALTTVLMSFIHMVRAWQDHSGDTFWDLPTWLRLQGVSLMALVAGILWYAPITAFLLLVSAWARRSVQLWVFLPPIILMMMERIGLGTNHLMQVIFYRLGGVFTHPATSGFAPSGGATGQSGTLNLLFTNVDPFPVFRNVDMWIGLAVAVALIVVTIRIRQYRDDT